MIRISDFIPGKKYRFISLINKEPGQGLIFLEIVNETRSYKYISEDGETTNCHPSPYSEFAEDNLNNNID